MIQIPVHLEDRDASLSVTEDSRFILETTSYSTLKDNRGWRQEQYDSAWREGISFDELIKWLPDISNTIKEDIVIESDTSELSPRHNSPIDLKLYITTYTVKVRNKTVFDKNTLKDGSIRSLRTEIVEYIARLIYDYDLYMEFFRR